MLCDNPEISVGMYWLVHNIDSALIGQHYLGVSATDSIKWNVLAVAKKMQEMVRIVREGRKLAK